MKFEDHIVKFLIKYSFLISTLM